MATPKEEETKKFSSPLAGLMWWTTLMMAVITVPLIGASVALAVTHNQFAQMGVFIVSCWLSTWFGMWLMRKADGIHNKK